jgi:glycine/D-amino acid oxidase-like deaminating enzyme
MISKSPWGLGATQPTLPILNRSLSTEVCVIGAGISGLTTAYLLAHEGKKVVVIDDGPIGGGETYATSAHLCNALDNRFRVLERYHGVAGSRLAAEKDELGAMLQQYRTFATAYAQFLPLPSSQG